MWKWSLSIGYTIDISVCHKSVFEMQKLRYFLASFSSLKSHLINLILWGSIVYLGFCNFVFKSHIELASNVRSSFEKCLKIYPNFTFCLWFFSLGSLCTVHEYDSMCFLCPAFQVGFACISLICLNNNSPNNL